MSKSDIKKFVILSSERSGSNLLIFMLRSHPEIFVRGELFQNLAGRTENEILEQHFSGVKEKTKAAGFKLFYDHPFDTPDSTIWEFLDKPDVSVILLTRKNSIRNYVSYQIALKTNEWHQSVLENKPNLDERKVTVNVDQMLSFLVAKENQVNEAFKRYSRKSFMSITYEDMISDPKYMRALMEFLGVRIHNLKSRIKKQNVEELKDLIANFDEVADKLKDTKYENYLYRPDPENIVCKDRDRRKWIKNKKKLESFNTRLLHSAPILFAYDLIKPLEFEKKLAFFLCFIKWLIPVNTIRKQAATELTQYYIDRDRPNKASKWANRINKNDADDEYGLLATAQIKCLLGKKQESLETWSKAYEKFPKSHKIAIGLAKIKFDLGLKKEAFSVLRKAHHSNKNNVEIIMLMSKYLQDENQVDEALDLLIEARKSKPRNSALMTRHYQLLFSIEVYSNARNVCEEFIKDNRRNVVGYIHLIRLAIHLKDDGEVLELISFAKKRFANNPVITLLEIDYHQKKNNTKEIRHLINQARLIFPRDLRFYKAKIKSLSLGNEYEKVETILLKLIKRYPKQIDFSLLLCKCLLQQGKLTEAQQLLIMLAKNSKTALEPQFYKHSNRAFEEANQDDIRAFIQSFPIEENKEFMFKYLSELNKQEFFLEGILFCDRLLQIHSLDEGKIIGIKMARTRFELMIALINSGKDQLASNLEKLAFEAKAYLGAIEDGLILPFEIDPRAAVHTILQVVNAIENKRPYSFVRTHAEIRNPLSDKFANLFGLNADSKFLSKIHSLKQSTIDSISSTDILGVESIQFGTGDTIYNRSSEIDGLIKSTSYPQLIIPNHAHLALDSWGLFDYLFSFIRSCYVISPCKEINEALWKRFRLRVEQNFLIPTSSDWRVNIDSTLEEDLNQMIEIGDSLKRNWNGEVVLIEAGVWSCHYARIIKENGGIAIDIGELLSTWYSRAGQQVKDEPEPLSYLKSLIPNQDSLSVFEKIISSHVKSPIEKPVHYWINLAKAKQRKNEMEALFEHYSIKNVRIEAISPSTIPTIIEPTNHKLSEIEYACLSSHFMAILKGWESKKSVFIVQEDDLRIPHQISLESLVSMAPQDWEVLQLHIASQTTVRDLYEHFREGELWSRWQEKSMSALIYAIRNEAAKKLICRFYDIDKNQIDLSGITYPPVPDALIFKELKTYSITFPVFNPANVDSQIHPDHMRFQRISFQTSEALRIMSHAKNPRMSIWTGGTIQKGELGD